MIRSLQEENIINTVKFLFSEFKSELDWFFCCNKSPVGNWFQRNLKRQSLIRKQMRKIPNYEVKM